MKNLYRIIYVIVFFSCGTMSVYAQGVWPHWDDYRLTDSEKELFKNIEKDVLDLRFADALRKKDQFSEYRFEEVDGSDAHALAGIVRAHLTYIENDILEAERILVRIYENDKNSDSVRQMAMVVRSDYLSKRLYNNDAQRLIGRAQSMISDETPKSVNFKILLESFKIKPTPETQESLKELFKQIKRRNSNFIREKFGLDYTEALNSYYKGQNEIFGAKLKKIEPPTSFDDLSFKILESEWLRINSQNSEKKDAEIITIYKNSYTQKHIQTAYIEAESILYQMTNLNKKDKVTRKSFESKIDLIKQSLEKSIEEYPYYGHLLQQYISNYVIEVTNDLVYQGNFSEGIELVEYVIRATSIGDLKFMTDRAYLMGVKGYLYLNIGDFAHAIQDLEAAIVMFENNQDQDVVFGMYLSALNILHMAYVQSDQKLQAKKIESKIETMKINSQERDPIYFQQEAIKNFVTNKIQKIGSFLQRGEEEKFVDTTIEMFDGVLRQLDEAIRNNDILTLKRIYLNQMVISTFFELYEVSYPKSFEKLDLKVEKELVDDLKMKYGQAMKMLEESEGWQEFNRSWSKEKFKESLSSAKEALDNPYLYDKKTDIQIEKTKEFINSLYIANQGAWLNSNPLSPSGKIHETTHPLKAFDLYLLEGKLYFEQMNRALEIKSDAEIENNIYQSRGWVDLILSKFVENQANDKINQVYDSVQLNKGLLRNYAKTFVKTDYTGDFADAWEELHTVHRALKIANFVSEIYFMSKRDSLENLQSELQRKINLKVSIQDTGLTQKRSESIALEQIRASLPDNSVFLDFTVYSKIENELGPIKEKKNAIHSGWFKMAGMPVPKNTYRESIWKFGEEHLIAFVIDRDSIDIINLGPEKLINNQIEKWKILVDLEGDVYDPADRIDAMHEVEQALYQKIWKPIWQDSTPPRQVIISPDGILNQVSFAALRDEKNEPLIAKDLVISYITSARDLIQEDMPVNDGYGASLAVGVNDFGSTSEPFADLENAVPEAQDITSLWKKKGVPAQDPLLNAEATLTNLEASIQRPRFLHIASHGFDGILGELRSSEFFLAGKRGGSGYRMGPKPVSAEVQNARLDSVAQEMTRRDSLSLSMIALANSNDVFIDPDTDGLMLSSDVVDLDVAGTEVVFLSSCSTASGRIVLGQGMRGLREAFVIAGAQNFISSLYPVDDRGASEFSKIFYTHLLDKKQTVSMTLRETQREMRRRLMEEQNGLDDSSKWASFVLDTPKP